MATNKINNPNIHSTAGLPPHSEHNPNDSSLHFASFNLPLRNRDDDPEHDRDASHGPTNLCLEL